MFKMRPVDLRCISAFTKFSLGNSSSSEIAKGNCSSVDSPKMPLGSACTVMCSYYHGEQL